MKKTNRELAEFYGIEVGDVVEVEIFDNVEKYKVMDLNDTFPLKKLDASDISVNRMGLNFLINREYAVTKHKKKVGETKCSDYKHCEGCPVRIFMCGEIEKDADFYTGVDKLFDNYQYGKDSPIYIALKAELDKEVE